MSDGITIEQYEEHKDSFAGYCTRCDVITEFSGIEPGADGYTCPDCGEATLLGMDEALAQGYVY